MAAAVIDGPGSASEAGVKGIEITPSDSVKRLSTLVINALKGNPLSEEAEHELQRLTAEDLTPLFQLVSAEIVKMKDPLKACDAMVDLFSLDNLIQGAGLVLAAHENVVERARNLAGSAEFFMKHAEVKSGHVDLQHLLEKAWVACGNIIMALGMKDLFDPPDGPYDASFKVQKLFLVIQAYSILLSLATALLGAKMGVIVIASLFILISIMSMVYPMISPPPHQLLTEVKNWTLEAKRGELPRVEGREEQKQEIADELAIGNNVLVTGESGVGKTKTIQGFVYDLLENKYPKLQGKRVFYVNGACLLNSMSWNSDEQVFPRMVTRMAGHEKEVVIVVDEIQALFEADMFGNLPNLGKQLLTMLDPDTGGFPNFIGVTTSEGYLTMLGKGTRVEQGQEKSAHRVRQAYMWEERTPTPSDKGSVVPLEGEGLQESQPGSPATMHPEGLLRLVAPSPSTISRPDSSVDLMVEDDSLPPHSLKRSNSKIPIDRRFTKVEIPPASGEELFSMLSAFQHRMAPNIVCEKGVLKHLISRVKAKYLNPQEPAQSIDVLQRALHALSKTTPSPLAEQVREVQQKLFALHAKASHSFSLHSDPLEDSRRELNKRLAELSAELEAQQKNAEPFYERAELFLQVRRRYLLSMLKVSKLVGVHSDEDHKEMKRFVLLGGCLNDKMYDKLLEESKDKSINLILSKQLIDEVLSRTGQSGSQSSRTPDHSPDS